MSNRFGTLITPALEGWINGLIAANNGTDAASDIDFGVGVAFCGDRIVRNTSTITKQLDANWASGNNQGGLFSGSKANSTWYHCFVMRNLTSGAVDFGFDTSVSGANKPFGWEARLIWSVKTDSSSNIIPFAQRGDRCVWVNQFADVITEYCPAATQLYTLSTPLGLNCDAVVAVSFFTTDTAYLYIANGDAEPTPDYLIGRIDAQGGNVSPITEKNLTTNTASQIKVSANVDAADCYLVISVKSFLHSRGRKV